MVRSRTSRIYYGRRFYDYPISLSLNTVKNLGLGRTVRIGFSYLYALLRPVPQERTLEDFLVNRVRQGAVRHLLSATTRKRSGGDPARR